MNTAILCLITPVFLFFWITSILRSREINRNPQNFLKADSDVCFYFWIIGILGTIFSVLFALAPLSPLR